MKAPPQTRPLIVCPLEFERKQLLRSGVAAFADIECCGPAAQGIESLKRSAAIANRRVVVLAGLCGALVPDIEAGSAFCIAEVVHAETRERLKTLSLNGSAPRRTLACVQSTLRTADSKSSVHRATGAELVDLESAPFALLANARGWRWAIVRGVSDDSSTPLPNNIDRWVRTNGSSNLPVILGTMIRRPASIGMAIALKRRGTVALRAVASLAIDIVAAANALDESEGRPGPVKKSVLNP